MAGADRDVLIVDDDIVAEAVAAGIRSPRYTVCGIANTFERALELTARHESAVEGERVLLPLAEP